MYRAAYINVLDEPVTVRVACKHLHLLQLLLQLIHNITQAVSHVAVFHNLYHHSTQRIRSATCTHSSYTNLITTNAHDGHSFRVTNTWSWNTPCPPEQFCYIHVAINSFKHNFNVRLCCDRCCVFHFLRKAQTFMLWCPGS